MFSILLKKDLFYEFRSKEVLLSMLAFGLTVLLIFSFAVSGTPKTNHELAPGLFWSLILLSSSLGLHRLLGQEKDMDAFSSVLSAPISRSTIFFSKWVSSSIFLLIVQVIVIVPLFLFLGLSKPINTWIGIGLMILGNLGINAVGVTIAGLSMRAKMSAILLPVLLFPLLSPLLIASVKSTIGWYHVLPFDQWSLWVLIMFTYVVVFTIAGYIFFEYITEE